MATEIVSLGRGAIYDDLRFCGEVAGGGAVGPGNIYKVLDYGKNVAVRWDKDCRSGSKRSGSCIWQLEKNALYALHDIAYNSSRSATYYVSTYGDEPQELSEAEFEAEKRRIYPLGYELAQEAHLLRQKQEEERIARQTAEAELRRIEREALAELNAEKAADIAKNGQPDDGFPTLTGSHKQVAYAISIRNAFAVKNPNHRSLKTATTAKYWIENHRSVLFK
jgi:hypothetical protein